MLSEACCRGRTDVVELLCSHDLIKSIINNVDGESKFSPLAVACDYGDAKMVTCLLDHGADYTFARGPLTVFRLAYDAGKIDIIESLCKHPIVFADSRFFEIINKPDSMGETIFTSACFQGDVKTVKLMLNFYGGKFDILNAQCSVEDPSGHTPFSLATLLDDQEMLAILGSLGINESTIKLALHPHVAFEQLVLFHAYCYSAMKELDKNSQPKYALVNLLEDLIKYQNIICESGPEIQNSIRDAIKIVRDVIHTERLNILNQYEPAAKHIMQSIRSLPQLDSNLDPLHGPCVVVLGGTIEHGIVYSIRREDYQGEEGAKFSFVIVNTGDGTEQPDENDLVSDLKYTQLELDKQLNEEFFVSLSWARKEDYTVEELLSYIDKKLSRAGGSNKTLDRKHELQNGMTCFNEAMMSWLQGWLSSPCYSHFDYWRTLERFNRLFIADHVKLWKIARISKNEPLEIDFKMFKKRSAMMINFKLVRTLGDSRETDPRIHELLQKAIRKQEYPHSKKLALHAAELIHDEKSKKEISTYVQ